MEAKNKSIYLYIKTSPLGLNYLGKTVSNPYTYMGSGLVWTRHLTKNSIDPQSIETKVIYTTTDPKKFATYAYKVSTKLGVVNSTEWANLVHEQGQGGNNWDTISEEGKKNFLESTKRPKSEEHKRKIGLTSLGRISTQRKPIIQLSLEGYFIAEYESMTAGCAALGKKPNQATDIKHCIVGSRSKKQRGKWITIKCQQAFGYKWQYK